MEEHAEDGQALARLLAIVDRLRGEDGCPWDRKQTPQTLKKYLLEETAELAEAIDADNADQIREEIGDLFFILAMLTAMFHERGLFGAADALADSIAKMIRRHPHVFAGRTVTDEQKLRRQWEAIKADEKRNR